MTGERLTGIDKGTLLAEGMLGDEKVLRTLIAGGQKKEIILQRIVTELGSDPVGQACFLRTLFQNLAKEGLPEVTDRRDGAMGILTDTQRGKVRLTEAMIPLVEANRAATYEEYLSAVQQQTKDNDPLSGSVDALLEAGIAIAPHLKLDDKSRRQIIHTWERAKEQFPTIDQRLHIHGKLEEIKEGMSAGAYIDAQVERLRRGQGIPNSQIAKELGRNIKDIERSASRLIAAGRIERIN